LPETAIEKRQKRSQFSCPTCPGQENSGALFFYSHDYKVDDGNYASASCPSCGNKCDELWYARTFRIKFRGPQTVAGKRKSSMNSVTTGETFKRGSVPKYYPPAKPGKFSQCETCQDIENCTAMVESAKGTSRYVSCHRRSEIENLYLNALSAGDPELLKHEAAKKQAQAHVLLDECHYQVREKGVLLNHPVMVGDKVFMEQRLNPAVTEAIKMTEKLGYTLPDWTMTRKSKEQKEAFQGNLVVNVGTMNLEDFKTEQMHSMKKFERSLIDANKLIEADPVLKESQEEDKAHAEGEELE